MTSNAVRIVACLLTIAAAGGGELTQSERDWLAQHVIAFKPDASGGDQAGDKAFRTIMGKSRIVAVGECTHGTSEFFRVKRRIAELLAADSAFTIFALETGMAEARQIDEFIHTGQGDPKQLLIGMGYWDWSTEEFLDLIRWMRRECAKSPKVRLQFSGFDMQTPDQALENVRAFLHSADPSYETAFRKAFAPIYQAKSPAWLTLKKASSKDIATVRTGSQQVFDHLQKGRTQYVKERPALEVDWAIQSARLVVQNIEFVSNGGSSKFRDACMAENAAWLLEHAPPGSRMVLSAHNDHIARSSGTMGDSLSKRFGSDYLVLGCALHHGHYNAFPLFGSGGPEPRKAAAPRLGSAEYYLHQTGSPALVLDLRQARRDSAAAWLRPPLALRSIGWKAQLIEFAPRALADEFDALIFFDETSPSKLLQ
jgi:erythromycin esterase